MHNNKRKVSIVNLFSKSIPKPIRPDIEYIVEKTQEDNKERSLTLCNVFSKGANIQTGGYAVGNKGSTDVVNCNPNLGKSVKVGDVHTHPVSDQSPNITPSIPDFVGTAVDSTKTGVRQISCITNHISEMIHCYRPKQSVGYAKANRYVDAYVRAESDIDSDPYLRDNIPRDFEHLWYNRKNFNLIRNPKVDAIVEDALGESIKPTRDGKYFHELEKGSFCELIADFNVGDSKINPKVADKCRDRLRRYSILGIKFSGNSK